MEEQTGAKNISYLAEEFSKFMRQKQEHSDTDNDWKGIFSFGTMIEFKLDGQEFEKYDESIDFPKYRVDDSGYLSIINENQKYLNMLLENNSEYVHVIKRAYYDLIGDGYPYPGDLGADRITYPVFNTVDDSASLYVTLFPERNKSILTLTKEGDAIHSVYLRRYDYMMPRLKYLIGPDCRLIKLKKTIDI